MTQKWLRDSCCAIQLPRTMEGTTPVLRIPPLAHERPQQAGKESTFGNTAGRNMNNDTDSYQWCRHLRIVPLKRISARRLFSFTCESPSYGEHPELLPFRLDAVRVHLRTPVQCDDPSLDHPILRSQTGLEGRRPTQPLVPRCRGAARTN